MSANDELDKNAGVRTTVYLPKKLHRQLKIVAFETDMSASEIVREALKRYLSQQASGKVTSKAATAISQ